VNARSSFQVQKPLPAADPGAHIDISLPNGITRQYSLVIPQPLNPRSWLDL
jgi:ferredoxin-NADP reductase